MDKKLTGEALLANEAITTISGAQRCAIWRKYIDDAIADVNRNSEVCANNCAKIQYWRILPYDFSISGGELTATLKLRRGAVMEKWEKVIDEMYKVTSRDNDASTKKNESKSNENETSNSNSNQGSPTNLLTFDITHLSPKNLTSNLITPTSYDNDNNKRSHSASSSENKISVPAVQEKKSAFFLNSGIPLVSMPGPTSYFDGQNTRIDNKEKKSANLSSSTKSSANNLNTNNLSEKQNIGDYVASRCNQEAADANSTKDKNVEKNKNHRKRSSKRKSKPVTSRQINQGWK